MPDLPFINHQAIMLFLDPESGAILGANPAACEFYGYTRAELTQMKITDLNTLSEEEVFREMARARSHQRHYFNFRHRLSSGDIRAVEVYSGPVELKGRNILFSIIHDVTDRQQAEIYIQEQSAFLRNVLESLTHPFYVIDAETYELRLANSAALRDKVNGNSTCYVLTHHLNIPCSQAGHLCPLEEIKRTRQPVIVEHVHLDQDGTPHSVEVHGYPIFDKEGHISQMIEYTQDITQRRQAEDALRESEARYRSLFESSPISLWEEDFSACKARIDQLKESGVSDLRDYLNTHPDELVHWISQIQILDVNQRTLELYRAESKQDLINNLERLVTGDLMHAFREGFIAMSQGDLRFHDELTVQPFSGDPIYVMFWLTVAPGHEHTWDRVVISLLETTERKLAEQAMRDSEERFRRFANLTREGIVIHIQGHVVDANEAFAQMVGYPLDEIVGGDLMRLFAPESRGIMTEKIMIGFEETYEAVGLQANGVTFPVEILAKAVPYEGRMARVAVVRDITERKYSQQRVIDLAVEREKVAILERFIGDASHDLKTPITTMKVSLSVLEHSDDPIKHERHLEILNSQVAHMQQLMEDLLSMVRLDKFTELRFTSLDVNMIVQGVLTETRLLAEQKNHTVIFEPELERIPLLADRDKLSQAIQVLVTNALNYTPNGGTITLRARIDLQGAIRIEVRDTGIGISQKDLPHIFERFYRADPARNTFNGGLGLGLTIAQKIVEAHQGRIEVDSTPERGSLFVIVLPAHYV